MTVNRIVPWLIAVPLLAIAGGAQASKNTCARIIDRTIHTSDGEPIRLGFDDYGYNYQAHLFVGSYCDSLRGAACDPAYESFHLTMKWSDDWLSNRDCTGDGLLDRPASYRGSGAWLTNHLRGTYELEGKTCHYRRFTVYVAAPLDAELVDGVFYQDGDELGAAIWGDFYVAERLVHDPCEGATDESI